jgi:hypothetical protein
MQKKEVKLPYIVSIDEGSGEVLSIYRNYNQDDDLAKRREYFVHYKFFTRFRLLWFWFNSYDWWII